MWIFLLNLIYIVHEFYSNLLYEKNHVQFPYYYYHIMDA